MRPVAHERSEVNYVHTYAQMYCQHEIWGGGADQATDPLTDCVLKPGECPL